MRKTILHKRAFALRFAIASLVFASLISLPYSVAESDALESPSAQVSGGSSREHYFHRESFLDPGGYVMNNDKPKQKEHYELPLRVGETASFYTYAVQDEGGAVIAKGEWAIHLDVAADGDAAFFVSIGIGHADGTENMLINDNLSVPLEDEMDDGIYDISQNWNKQPAYRLAQGDRLFVKVQNNGPSENVSLYFDSPVYNSRLKTPKIDPPIEISAITIGGCAVGLPLFAFGFSKIYKKHFGLGVKK